MLLQVKQPLTKIAEAVGCSSPQTVLDWRRGRKVPVPVSRTRLFIAYQIPPESWSCVPTDGTNGHTSKLPDLPLPSTLAQCLELLSAIRTARINNGLQAAERVKLAASETQILSLRHRLEREADMSEDRVVKQHPRWQLLKRTLVKTLAAHPAAAKAVAQALAELDE